MGMQEYGQPRDVRSACSPLQLPSQADNTACLQILTVIVSPPVTEAAVVVPAIIPARGAAPGRVPPGRRVSALIPVAFSARVPVGVGVVVLLPVVPVRSLVLSAT